MSGTRHQGEATMSSKSWHDVDVRRCPRRSVGTPARSSPRWSPVLILPVPHGQQPVVVGGWLAQVAIGGVALRAGGHLASTAGRSTVPGSRLCVALSTSRAGLGLDSAGDRSSAWSRRLRTPEVGGSTPRPGLPQCHRDWSLGSNPRPRCRGSPGPDLLRTGVLGAGLAAPGPRGLRRAGSPPLCATLKNDVEEPGAPTRATRRPPPPSGRAVAPGVEAEAEGIQQVVQRPGDHVKSVVVAQLGRRDQPFTDPGVHGRLRRLHQQAALQPALVPGLR
jgi:hypothetical protein